MAKDDAVQENETLYRAALGEGEQYTCDEGEITIEARAFRDRDQQPSVNREELTEYDPALFLCLAHLDKNSGVVSLNAGKIRDIELEHHTVEIIPAPDDDNRGHAKIIMIPQRCVSKSKRKDEFDSLRDTLAEIATDDVSENGWTLDPKE
jgi:hypothetical protein